MTRVALLGLGIMGAGMAQNVLRAGYSLTVYNRTRERAAPLEAAGASIADSPRAAAQMAEVVISMVSDDRASQVIWLGPDGALAGAQHGAILIESSTLSTTWVRQLAVLAAERGCHFLDAPVSGSKPQVEAGELIFFVGGDAEVLEQVRPVLLSLGRRIEHLGPVGSGAIMKLINNLMGGVQIAVLAEGILLAQQAGLSMEQVIPLLINGAPGSPIVKGKAARIVARDYNTHFALRWMHKDLTYALEEAIQRNLPMPTVAAAREIYRLAMARGLSNEDFSAVAEAIRPSGSSAAQE